MKITFFDILPHEEQFFREHLDDLARKHSETEALETFRNGDFGIQISAVYIKTSAHIANDFPPETYDSEIISVFIPSNLTSEVLSRFHNLKFILLRSVGYSNVDLRYCKEHDIHIFNAPNYGDYTVAEYVFASLLALIRQIVQSNSALRSGNILLDKYMGIELYNKTIGVIGTGAIGSKVVKIAKGFSMNVLAYDINKNTDVEYVSLDELCKEADIISINTPLTPETVHMFDKNRINSLKNGAIIVNTARGEIIDTDALYNALLAKKVGYAALDVIECEDLLWQRPNFSECYKNIKNTCLKNFLVANRLLKMDNVLITPHTAYDTREATQRILEITFENLKSCLNFDGGAKNQVLI